MSSDKGEGISKCPVDHAKLARNASSEPSQSDSGWSRWLPFSSASTSSSPVSASDTNTKSTGCPVKHSSGPNSLSEEINPLNNMPELSQTMATGQQYQLSTERVISSIPKPAETDKKINHTKSSWEYPSPQQFYNALKRKGKEAPEQDIPMMVDIHNFLNEETWLEILKWEQKYHPECDCLYLNKFQGKPDQLSPRAWFFSTFMGADKPFDRHDWYVDRCGKEQRYVIDYYSAPSEGGQPAFSVDVRPALDSTSSILDQIKHMSASVWDRVFQ